MRLVAAWLLVAGFCAAGAGVSSDDAAPKSVLILAEGRQPFVGTARSSSCKVSTCIFTMRMFRHHFPTMCSSACFASLRAVDEVLLLSVADFGRGFEETASIRKGLGLASMRERLRLIEGEFSIHSQLGEGTTIIAEVPISKTNARSAAKIAS